MPNFKNKENKSNYTHIIWPLQCAARQRCVCAARVCSVCVCVCVFNALSIMTKSHMGTAECSGLQDVIPREASELAAPQPRNAPMVGGGGGWGRLQDHQGEAKHRPVLLMRPPALQRKGHTGRYGAWGTSSSSSRELLPGTPVQQTTNASKQVRKPLPKAMLGRREPCLNATAG